MEVDYFGSDVTQMLKNKIFISYVLKFMCCLNCLITLNIIVGYRISKRISSLFSSPHLYAYASGHIVFRYIRYAYACKALNEVN